ncbi:MAG: glycerol-3-phosphate acyltransferase, partial [Methylocystis sp.]|nr:glycerol-3-phosphate acyltransferase [Methylocystis sp.]
MNSIIYDIVALAIGYLLGSIPFGLLLTRLAGTTDLRAIGSGNIGATNVLRTGRKDLAAATLLLDGLKGTAPALVGASLAPEGGMIAGLAACIGHVAPV